MIDIIIPAYNSHSTILDTLSSISIQQFKLPYKVTIVNDGGEGYSDIVKSFAPRMDIQVIDTPNKGPAIARQIGMEATSNPFILFIDADDIFLSAISFQLLYSAIAFDEDIICVDSKFMSEREDGSIELGNKEMVWLFGNIYRRSFIEENEIKFPIFSANEDLIFNFEIMIKSSQLKKKIVYIDEHTYLWKWNKNSITRRNNSEYSFFDSSYHIIKGKTELFSRFNPEEIAEYIFHAVWDFYFFWEESINNRSQKTDYHNNLMEAIKEYYHKFDDILKKATDEDWKWLDNKKKNIMNHYNRISFLKFISIIKNQQG